LLRKHRIAFIALAVYHFVFFFPALFMQRIPSPNDVFSNYDPWALVRTVDVQNSLLNDPPTSYFTLMTLMKRDWSAFHWNPFIASGVPGFGSAASAVMTPFVLLPVFLLPLAWVYAGIILIKLNAAFFFAYLWLREERLGRNGAAAGAIVIAAAGAYAVRWWWQATNATALYPALLWIVVRVMRGKRVPLWSVFVIAFVYAIAGFPAAMLYGAYVALVYAAVIAVRARRVPRSGAFVIALLGIAAAAPMVVPFVQFLQRSGYLETRANSAGLTFPLRHLALFIDPDRLGNNAYHDWTGDVALGPFNVYTEATVYLGLLPLALALGALANRKARSRWFWFGALLFVGAAMFGVTPIDAIVARLPYMQYSPLTRLQLFLPLPMGYLAAAGTRLVARKRWVLAGVLVALIAADLAVFAGRFYPFITPDAALPPATPMTQFLQRQSRPFRIAAFFNYLWPNAAEMYEIEDTRAHFSSEAAYRQMLSRIDPTSSSAQHTVIQFDSRTFKFSDPFTGLLGIRYYIEHKGIDILRWTVFANSTPAVGKTDLLVIRPGDVLERDVPIAEMPFYSMEIAVKVRKTTTTTPRLVVTLRRGNDLLFRRAFTPEDIAVMNKIYVPVYAHLRQGDVAHLRVESQGIEGESITCGGLCYARVSVPLMFDRELPDGRVFINSGEAPRFRAARRVTKMSRDDFFVKTTATDFRDEAIITDPKATAIATADATVTLRRYENDNQVLTVDAPAGTFLASSEKLTPELRVTIDGRAVEPVETNLLFAGVTIPPGRHEVVFSRSIGRGWWWVSALATLAAIALAITDVVRRR
jgi:hypothetical protein